MSIDVELENIKYLLSINEINENEYKMREQEIISNRKIEKEQSTSKIKLGIGIEFILLFAILIGGVIWLDSTYVNKEYKIVEDLRNLPEPIQTSTTGYAEKVVCGETVRVDYLAEYQIQGRVVDVQDYMTYDFDNYLSPVDLGIAWGHIARDENIEKLEFASKGTRFLSYNTTDRAWYSNNGGWNNIGRYISNNHIIPADDEIGKALKAVKVDDYIELTGYLVRATCSNSSFRWTSSLNREDDGAGACEVIYVESVKWLKEATN